MASPARRKQPLPAHDPRAIRGALRREIYEFGDSFRFLEDIEFVVVEREGVGRAVKPIVNRIDLVEAIEHVPVPVASSVWHYSGLNDAEGRREDVPFTWGPQPGSSGDVARLGVGVAGRYVRRTLGDALGNVVLAFDRATYRERLAAVLVGDPAESLDEYLSRATRLIAQWQPEELATRWSGTARPPHYSAHWEHLGDSWAPA